MKKFVFVVSLFLFFACDMKNSEEDKDVTRENYSISTSEVLEINLGGMPVEGGTSISNQAQHHQVSEIQHRDSGLVYVYKPEEGFTGSDSVELTTEHHNGATVYATTVKQINIKVED